MSILYISHKLDEIQSLCDKATVLRATRVYGDDPEAWSRRARYTAGRVGESELLQLRAIVVAQDEAHAAGDFDRFFVLDDAFHEALCEASGHGIAWSLAQRADGHLVRVRRLSLPVPEYMGEMIDEHRAVLEAIAAHDPDEAEATLRHHLRMVLSVLEAIRAEHPAYFAEE